MTMAKSAEKEVGLPSLEALEKVLWYDPLKLGHFHFREFAAVASFALAVGAILAAEAALLVGVPALTGLPGWVRFAVHAACWSGLGCVFYGVFVEPYRVVTRSVRVPHPKIKGPVRLLHIGDLHVRHWSRVEEGVMAEARRAVPDLIVLSGDYSALPGSLEALGRLLKELAAVAPVYAALGNAEYLRPVHQAIRVPGLTWLDDDNRAVTVRGTALRVYGIRPGSERNFWQLGRNTRPFEFGVCLYHFPDFAPVVERVPYELMLSGHTHGGQIQLPYVGALISMSRAGTAYTAGVFRSEGKTAVVTSGVGCESYGLPRARFLCPPEVVVVDLASAGT
jgi:predicted MPP superfamily phosphohydrolase